MLKEMKWSSIISSLLYIAAGVILILYPENSAELVCNITGIIMMVYGVIEIINYFTLDIRDALFRADLIVGLMALLAGAVIFFKKDLLLNLIPIIFGILIVVSGFSKLQNAVVAHKIGYKGAVSYLILSVVSIVLGFAIMFFLSGTLAAKTLFIIIGISCLYSGCSDLFVTLYLSRKYKKFMDAFKRKLKEDDVIDVQIESENDDDTL